MAPPAIPHAVAEAAMTWWVELQSDSVTSEMQAACDNWRAEHPLHEQAWQTIVSAHRQLGSTGLPGALAHSTLATRHSQSRRRAIKTLTLLAFAGTGAWTLQHQQLPEKWLADYRTGRGERREIQLADGTRITLDTHTAVDVRLDTQQRCLRLLSGRIHIDTAKDGRPFFVETEQGQARALGTRFTVQQNDQDTSVIVYQGAVALHPADRNTAPQTLTVGQQAYFGHDAVSPVESAIPNEAPWRNDMLIVTAMRLDTFIAELARYRSGWLICDAEVADLRVSGSFPLADTDKVLDILSQTLPVTIQRRTRLWAAVRPRH